MNTDGSKTSGIKLAKGMPFAIALQSFLSPLGMPCHAPPWGYVAGVDLTSGKTIWKHKAQERHDPRQSTGAASVQARRAELGLHDHHGRWTSHADDLC